MKKCTMCLLLFLITGLILAGYAQAAPTPPLPESLNFGTHPVGTTFNLIGTAVAKVVSAHTPIDVKLKPVAGPTSWMPMMVTKEMDLGICSSWDSWAGCFGKEVYGKISGGKGFPVLLAATGLRVNSGLVVAGDCPARTTADLKGLRVSGKFAGVPSAYWNVTAQLANGGLTWDDVKMVPTTNPGTSVQAVMEGKTDAGMGMTGQPNVTELAAKKGAHYISLDPSPEAVARMSQYFPVGYPALIKAGTFPGADRDVYLLAFEVYVLCRADLLDNAIYEINKALWDYNDELRGVARPLKGWTRGSFVSKKLVVPYHPGAVKFLKEKDLWNDKLEARQQELLATKK